MIYSYPDYYDKFNCIAEKCPDTCCAQWQIVIDDDSLENYLNDTGEYAHTLHRNINWNEGVFRHGKRGTCAFLREDMLCDLYVHMGKDSLCTTCREYPRHTEEFENVREISLSLSCPEVARILMNHREKVTFVTKEDRKEEVFEDFDYFLFSNLEDIREEVFRVLQNRELPLRSRFAKVLQIGASAQRHYEEGDLVLWNACGEQDLVRVENEYELLKNQAAFLSEELELLYSDWETVLLESDTLLFAGGEAAFCTNQSKFQKWWEQSSLTPMEIVLEQIVVYFIAIYLPGAVYDENIVGKVDACIGHGVEIYMLLQARWLKNKEHLGMEDLIEIVYRYSREIEHSDVNLEQVELLNWFSR